MNYSETEIRNEQEIAKRQTRKDMNIVTVEDYGIGEITNEVAVQNIETMRAVRVIEIREAGSDRGRQLFEIVTKNDSWTVEGGSLLWVADSHEKQLNS